ncbi:hypothetical protein H4J56_06475 [Colwellia sp. BRX8-4]|uniref:hypothetical protein n=1 Tax=Colwellia sp. BRX8-4 TaxID=2759836 RepID=UPI0015F69CBD|nr:hypothetical protein [Colwellia sp. BRX8-4]MBA6362224.1 hypothetical protein [Colwellia sp. BRX8-8]MBA6371072.1 hypothetical protein [Colwellia sp. BRX8-4]
MRNLSVIALSVTFLMACSDKREVVQPLEKKTSDKEAASLKPNTSDATTNETLARATSSGLSESNGSLKNNNVFKKLTNSENKYLMLNEQKFELQADKLTNGAKVVNLLMSETGTVKGTFVVIVNNLASLTSYENTANINKIAKSTYRLTPGEGVDLLSYYKSLVVAKQFERVEIEIDYSGQVGRPLAEER